MDRLDYQLQALVKRHGLRAVKTAMARLAQAKRGRRAE